MLTIHYTSEYSLLCLLPPPAELDKQQKLWALAELAKAFLNVEEVVVGMNNLTLFINEQANYADLSEQLQQCWQQLLAQKPSSQGRLVEIPVNYGGSLGEDLVAVAEYHQTTPREIIRRHTEPTYTVFMMGFQPGFPYLGGLPDNLHTPRHKTPRLQVPAGSVGIGGSQTGVYPFSSPGGWQLLGQTSIALFDIKREYPVLLNAGDQVRFVAETVVL